MTVLNREESSTDVVSESAYYSSGKDSRFSDSPSLYFATDLRSTLLHHVGEKPVLWVQWAEGLAPAWLLTPETFATLWWKCAGLEDRWAKGDYAPEKMATVWERWAKIEAFAVEWFGEADLYRAKAEVLRNGGPRRALPRPAECPAGEAF